MSEALTDCYADVRVSRVVSVEDRRELPAM